MEKCKSIMCAKCNWSWKRALGVIISGAFNINRCRMEVHEDISMWHAPIECHLEATRNYNEKQRMYWKKIETLYGCSKEQVEAEFEQRVKYSYRMHNLFMMIFT